jgi:hypothetical protein
MTITLKDLESSKELDSQAMATVAGGTEGMYLIPLLGNYTDFSTYNPIQSHQGAANFSLFNNGENKQSTTQESVIVSTGAIQAVGGFGLPF